MWVQLESGRVTHRFEWLVAAAAVALIPVLVVQHDVHSHGWQLVADIANWLIWIVFLVELVLIVLVAPRRRHAMRAHWFEVGLIVLTAPIFGAIVGGLRAVRVLRLGVVAGEAIKAEYKSASTQAFRFVATLTLFIVVVASAAEVVVDKKEFPTLWDGIWWSVVTVTTVGYGDYYPHTVLGRIVAICLMLFGIGFLSVLTAAIASRFVRSDTSSDEILATLTRIEGELAELKSGLAP